MNCVACNGPLEPLGFRGIHIHLRCRHCGLDHLTSSENMKDADIEIMMESIALDIRDDSA